jgi:hypothetical protein
LLSGQYKPIALEAKFNVCEYWKKDMYGTITHIKKFGNLEGCDTKKVFIVINKQILLL